MTFTQEQLQEILNIVEYHHLFAISTSFGTSMLSPEDLTLLASFGVDISLISGHLTLYDKMFLFGRLTGVLKDKQTKQVEYPDFLKFIKEGQYIPLSTREKFELDVAKRKTYVHLKGLRERAKAEVETIFLDKESYDNAIKEELATGVEKRKSASRIVSDLGHKFGTFKHDWGRIVETEMNNIFLEGLAMEMSKDGSDPDVYKEVYAKACRHCLAKYLTNGVGSEPRIFKLSQLIKNGTNVGKKVADWLAVLGSMHPFCRCYLRKKPKGNVWSDENQMFEIPKNWVRTVERKSKVKITVGDKHFEV